MAYYQIGQLSQNGVSVRVFAEGSLALNGGEVAAVSQALDRLFGANPALGDMVGHDNPGGLAIYLTPHGDVALPWGRHDVFPREMKFGTGEGPNIAIRADDISQEGLLTPAHEIAHIIFWSLLNMKNSDIPKTLRQLFPPDPSTVVPGGRLPTPDDRSAEAFGKATERFLGMRSLDRTASRSARSRLTNAQIQFLNQLYGGGGARARGSASTLFGPTASTRDSSGALAGQKAGSGSDGAGARSGGAASGTRFGGATGRGNILGGLLANTQTGSRFGSPGAAQGGGVGHPGSSGGGAAPGSGSGSSSGGGSSDGTGGTASSGGTQGLGAGAQDGNVGGGSGGGGGGGNVGGAIAGGQTGGAGGGDGGGRGDFPGGGSGGQEGGGTAPTTGGGDGAPNGPTGEEGPVGAGAVGGDLTGSPAPATGATGGGAAPPPGQSDGTQGDPIAPDTGDTVKGGGSGPSADNTGTSGGGGSGDGDGPPPPTAASDSGGDDGGGGGADDSQQGRVSRQVGKGSGVTLGGGGDGGGDPSDGNLGDTQPTPRTGHMGSDLGGGTLSAGLWSNPSEGDLGDTAPSLGRLQIRSPSGPECGRQRLGNAHQPPRLCRCNDGGLMGPCIEHAERARAASSSGGGGPRAGCGLSRRNGAASRAPQRR